MFELADLDEREKVLLADADAFWALRFLGSGHYDRLGPFVSQEQVVMQVRHFFKQEDTGAICPPPATITKRPFVIYASSSKHNQGQVVLGNMFRDGVRRFTSSQVSKRRQEERARSRSSNPKRGS